MTEDELARSIRRGLSQQLTKTINDSQRYPDVRLLVIQSLSYLWGRLESLKLALRSELNLHEAQPLFYYYLKGGNAYTCVTDPGSPAATTQGGGGSDWDSQIVVDPWAPLPIQEIIYASIEDLIRDELRNCSINIGNWCLDPSWPDDYLFQAPQLLYRYRTVLDDPQTIRQVLDRDQTGLWVDTSRKISDQTVMGKLPGIVINDAIRGFQLFRLGYTWHASPSPFQAPPPPGTSLGPEISRPVLMELIDVSLPRRNTVEAVELWEELQENRMGVDATGIAILIRGVTVTVTLPLPCLRYHFREQLLMLCEVAAGISKSIDKVNSRFTRLRDIYNNPAANQQDCQQIMADMAGVPLNSINIRPAGSAVVDNILQRNGAGGVLALGAGPEFMALNMMYLVANRQLAYNDQNFRLASILVNELITNLNQIYPLSEVGISDDLAIYSMVVNSGYSDINHFPATEIDASIFLRLTNGSQLMDAALYLENHLCRWISNWTAIATPPQTHEQQWLVQTFFGKKLVLKRREHRTYRRSGMSKEQTLVIFADDRAVACITLTTALAAEAPFLPDPLIPGRQTASAVDLAEQRKLAAAVIKDFCIRNALAKQLSMLQALFASA